MEYILISNSLSGSYNPKKIETFKKEGLKHNIKFNELLLEYKRPVGELIDTLKPGKKYCIVFACGDGTINSAINSITKREDKDNFFISVIPMGTANVFCKELGIRTYKDTINLILNLKYDKMYFGEIEDLKENKNRLFFLIASVGLDSLAVYNLNEKLKKYVGKLAYIIAFIKSLFSIRKCNLSVEIENKKYSCKTIIIQKCGFYGGKFKVSNTTIFDKKLDAIIIEKVSIFLLLKFYFTKKSNKYVYNINCDSILIEGCKNGNEIPSEIDGDYSYFTPLKIKQSDKYLFVLKK